MKLNTKRQVARYRKWLDFWLDRNDANIELPPMADQDERLHLLGYVASASPTQRKIVKVQLDRQRTNWQSHLDELRRERMRADKEAAAAVHKANRLNAIDAYRAYAEKRGLSKQHIELTIKQIWKAIT